MPGIRSDSQLDRARNLILRLEVKQVFPRVRFDLCFYLVCEELRYQSQFEWQKAACCLHVATSHLS